LEVLSSGLGGTKLGPLDVKGCSKLMNYPTAEKFCNTAQHRLCTVDELKTFATGANSLKYNTCGYADKEVWTRTKASGVNDDVECQRPAWNGGTPFNWPEVTAKPPQEKATKCFKGSQFFIKKSGRCTDGTFLFFFFFFSFFFFFLFCVNFFSIFFNFVQVMVKVSMRLYLVT
jgi:hypothetical protein